MRVLFLCHRHTDTTVGGLAEFLHFLPPALANYDVTSVIYTQAANKKTQSLNQPTTLTNGTHCYSGPFLKPRFFPSSAELKPLLQLCEQEKIDLIHAQGTYRAGYMAMYAHKKIGIPYLVTSHSDILEVNSARMQRSKIQRRCKKILKKAAFITHLSHHMAEASHKILPTIAKSEIIPNGIDLSAWDAKQYFPEKNYMLAIGRLEKEKGFPILIEAYARLRQQGIKTSLIIAGTGSAEAELKAQAYALGLNVVTQLSNLEDLPEDSIIFTGYVRGEFKKTLFYQAKLILFATQPHVFEEAFGIVQLEAMAAKKALIASDLIITRYLQTLGLQAYLVEPTNVNAWAEAMATVLMNEELRLTQGLKNRECVTQFDWQLIAKKYADVYQYALRGYK